MTERTGGSGPFLAALAVAALALAAIGVLTLTRPDPPQEDLVARAAVAANDALQRADYADLQAYTCAAVLGPQSQVLAEQRRSVQERGARYLDEVTAVTVDGDRARATVTYHFDKSADDAIAVPIEFVRTDGAWKVCSPGP